MFIDGRTLPSGEALEADLCIIGGGAAAISLALEFVAQPVSVLVVEAGGLDYTYESQEIYQGEIVGHDYDIYGTRLRFFGGSTGHWGGYCRPFEEASFERRPWVPHSGWPIGRRHLDPFYPRAADLCQLGAIDTNAARWAERLDQQLFGFDRASTLQNLIFQVSPPTRFGEVYRPPLDRADNIKVLLNTTITRIRAADDAASIRDLDARTVPGSALRIRARTYVLAAGGLENPRLLLASDEVEKGGLGNRHDLVGRFFMEHAHFSIGRVALAPAAPDLSLFMTEFPGNGLGRVNAHIGVKAKAQREDEIAYAMVQVRPRIPSAGEKSLHYILGALKLGTYPEDLGSHMGKVLADVGEISKLVGHKVRQKLFHVAGISSEVALRSVGEQVPNPDSRVTLASALDPFGMPRVRLDWRLSELDRRTIARTGELLARELGRLGLGRVQLYTEEGEGAEPAFIEGGFHHIGTTRMADDPKQGVVDRHCRVHGIGNLYVAGSSVFPSSGGGTPTLTIVALALRLADHLKRNVFA